MKGKLNLEFKEKCFSDIEEIFNEIEDYLPKMSDWQFTQSVILDTNKKILCKSILDKNDKCIGYQIKMDIFLDTLYKYRLNILENSIELVKNYTYENKLIEELFKVELDKTNIHRICIYKEDEKYLKYCENLDSSVVNENICSFNELSNKLRGLYKEKKLIRK